MGGTAAIRFGGGRPGLVRELIFESGWGVLPVLIFGFILVALALAYAVSLRAELLPLLCWSGLLALGAGAIGTLAGVRSVLVRASGAPGEVGPALGLKEATGPLFIALMLTLMAGLIGTAGGFRVAWRALQKREEQ